MNVSFPDDHDNPENSQLLLAITGTPDAIIQRLEIILDQYKSLQLIENNNHDPSFRS